jgi:carbon-monoxide dehydrogenase large subunit
VTVTLEVQEKRLLDQAVPRIDAPEKVTGSAIFTSDLELPNMLYAAVLKSPHPHAKIISIDTSRAEQLPGVRAVVTGRDMPSLFGEMIRDRPVIAMDYVRFVGEPVAAVAAISERIAEEALDLIKVSYDELPAVFDPIEAMKESAPRIHENLAEYKKGPRGSIVKVVPDTNICSVVSQERGDVNKGFEESDFVFEDTFMTPPVPHAALEPHCSIAKVDADGSITLWTGNDSLYRLQGNLAEGLGIDRRRIRVIVPYVGGAFGGKGGVKLEGIAIALARKVVGNPVKLEYSREEVFTSTVTAHASVITVKTGIKKDGTILARHAKCVLSAGAYAERGPGVLMYTCRGGIGPYRTPNIKIEGYLVYTNKSPSDSYRGYGFFQSNFGVESQTDMIAEKLGMDPLQLRLKNIIRDGDTNVVGEEVTSCGLEECLIKAAKAIDWGKKDDESIGKGIACGFISTLGSSSAISLMLSWDGALNVYASLAEVGQGSKHILAKLAASELGIPMAKVKVILSDTEITPWDTSTTGSKSVFHQGNALLIAIDKLTEQLKAKLAAQSKVSPELVAFKNGRFVVEGQTLGFLEAAKKAMKAGEQILTYGWYEPEVRAVPSSSGSAQWSSIMRAASWMYGAYGVTVKVDSQTGQTSVLKIAVAQDVGKAMDRILTDLQMVGGAIQGMGMTLYEEVKFNEKGRMLNPNFRDYDIPSSTELPNEVTSVIVETPHLGGPRGAKGIGEFPLVPIQAAIANAIFDATGKRFKNFPITPERVAMTK